MFQRMKANSRFNYWHFQRGQAT